MHALLVIDHEPTRVRRYRMLIQQLLDERDEDGKKRTQVGVAKMIGRSQGWISQVLSTSPKGIDDSISAAVERLKILPGFFYDEALTRGPHYTAYLQGAARVERDDEQMESLRRFLDGFEPDDPHRPTEAEAAWLRGLSFRELRLAGLEVTPTIFGRMLREKRLQDSGRISRGLAADLPESEDTIDLPEPKRRRR